MGGIARAYFPSFGLQSGPSDVLLLGLHFVMLTALKFVRKIPYLSEKRKWYLVHSPF